METWDPQANFYFTLPPWSLEYLSVLLGCHLFSYFSCCYCLRCYLLEQLVMIAQCVRRWAQSTEATWILPVPDEEIEAQRCSVACLKSNKLVSGRAQIQTRYTSKASTLSYCARYTIQKSMGWAYSVVRQRTFRLRYAAGTCPVGAILHQSHFCIHPHLVHFPWSSSTICSP